MPGLRFFKRKKKMPDNENPTSTEEPKEQAVDSNTPETPVEVPQNPLVSQEEDSQEEAQEEKAEPTDVCDKCSGRGLLNPETLCDNCGGTGKI
jgi:hypothetical protein